LIETRPRRKANNPDMVCGLQGRRTLDHVAVMRSRYQNYC
jgi:hypothetical protein